MLFSLNLFDTTVFVTSVKNLKLILNLTIFTTKTKEKKNRILLDFFLKIGVRNKKYIGV